MADRLIFAQGDPAPQPWWSAMKWPPGTPPLLRIEAWRDEPEHTTHYRAYGSYTDVRASLTDEELYADLGALQRVVYEAVTEAMEVEALATCIGGAGLLTKRRRGVGRAVLAPPPRPAQPFRSRTAWAAIADRVAHERELDRRRFTMHGLDAATRWRMETGRVE